MEIWTEASYIVQDPPLRTPKPCDSRKEDAWNLTWIGKNN